jgi:DNA polymerase (family 10)
MAQLDYVVASIHNSMSQDEATMTARIIKAMENRHVTMLGHPTGRLILQREPYAVNLEKIIDCAAATGTWIELNCASKRMDMDWRFWRRARDKGVLCSINPDAHRFDQYGMVRHGATLARKGWLRAEDVVNTRKLEDVKLLLELKRKRF